ncbi:hypothetical protein [Actinomadura sp. B10D3]|uniref:hypothetical protein n=1 Tax=Actinomadura sp. B10D3 TaxID=3153557 RepID=UPI00325CCF96
MRQLLLTKKTVRGLGTSAIPEPRRKFAGDPPDRDQPNEKFFCVFKSGGLGAGSGAERDVRSDM